MNGTKQVTVQELIRKLNSKAFDLFRTPVYVMLPDDSIYPITNVTLVGGDKNKAVYLIAGEESKEL